MKKQSIGGRACLVLQNEIIFIDTLAAIMRDGDQTIFEFKDRDFTSYVDYDYDEVVKVLNGTDLLPTK